MTVHVSHTGKSTGIESILNEGWQRIPFDERRRKIAIGIFELIKGVDVDTNIQSLQEKWLEMTQETQTKFSGMILDGSGYFRRTCSISDLKNEVYKVIGGLYTGTNNDPLQPMWRSVTGAIEKLLEESG